MTELMPLRLSQLRLNATGEAIRALQSTAGSARLHADVEFLVSDFLGWQEEVRLLWVYAWELAAEGSVADFHALGQRLRALSEEVLAMMQEAITVSREAKESTGRPVRHAAELERVTQATRRWVDAALSSWPWPDRPWPKLDP